MDSAHGVGGRIRTLRKRRGLTQEELAARIGRSVNALSALERGLRKPAFDTLLCLAAALDVSARDFFTPAAGAADGPEQAALYGDLIDAARTLPPAKLEMAVQIVCVVARWHADDDR